MNKKLLLIEFNELCPDLLQKWMAAGELPNFKRFYEQSTAFVTEADAEPPNLNPWTQWFSVHCGKAFATHQVKRLTDGPKSPEKDMWSYFAENGLSVGNFSSMNCKSFAYDNSFYFPDPWTQTESPYPRELSRLNDFISMNVQQHASGKLNKAGVIKDFMAFYLRNGFRAGTLFKIAKQLVSEKLRKHQYWRRAFALDWLTMDIFASLIAKRQPDFATFFSNTTAHMQHSYWRHHEPDAFTIKPDQAEIDAYGNAILDAYKNHDRLLARFFELERRFDYRLVLCGALSQQPFTRYEGEGGQHFFRLLDAEKFIRGLGFTPAEVLPTMTHQFRVRFDDDVQAARIKSKLEGIEAPDGKSLFYCHLDSDREVYFACAVTSDMSLDDSVVIDGEPVVLSRLMNKIDGVKSGCHHADGVAWFKWGVARAPQDKVSVIDIFPTINEYFGLNAKIELEGRSILSQVTGG